MIQDYLHLSNEIRISTYQSKSEISYSDNLKGKFTMVFDHRELKGTDQIDQIVTYAFLKNITSSAELMDAENRVRRPVHMYVCMYACMQIIYILEKYPSCGRKP